MEEKSKNTTMYIIVAVVAVVIVGVIVFFATRNNDTTKKEITDGTSTSETVSTDTSSQTENKKKKSKITDTEAEATVYYGTKGNFQEYTVTVDQTKQAEEIIKDLIAEIAKHANYNIEMKSVTYGNKTLAIEFAESFNPDEATANKIYDSIYQTCYKAFGATSNYFDLANGNQVKRTIND